MKKIFCALLALTVATIFAYEPEDKVPDLTGVTWLKGKISLKPYDRGDRDKAPLRALAFFMTRPENSTETAMIMEEAANLGVVTAMITPESQDDAEVWLKRNLCRHSAFAFDSSRRQSSMFLGKSTLLPQVFAIAPDNTLLWSGEPRDFLEFLDRYKSGKFDLQKQKRMTPLLLELQALLRGGNEERLRQVTKQLLAIEPGCAPALRIRIFVLESTGRKVEAWDLLTSQIDQVPDLARLYITALDLAARNRELLPKFDALIDKKSAVITSVGTRNLLAWHLLTTFPDYPQALRSATLLVSGNRNLTVQPRDAANELLVRALLSLRCGDINKAIELQKQAINSMRSLKMDDTSAVETLKKYREIAKIAEKLQ